MTNYKNIFGKPVKFLATDPDNAEAEGQIWYNSTSDAFKSVVVSEAWSSGSPMIFNRAYIAGFGTTTAALGAGGYNSPPATFETATEEYNGSGWATGGALNTGRWGLRGAGSQTAGLVFFGVTPGPPGRTGATEEYDGSAWTNGGSLSEARYQGAAAGTQTAGLAFGGGPAVASPPVSTATEEYNGTAWTTGGALNTVTRDNGSASAAPQTAALSFGGNNGSINAQSEEYDGSTWTVVNSMNTARVVMGGSGVQTDALAYGGTVPPDSAATESYNGTSWSTSPATLATARRYLAGAGSNGSAAVAFQGKSGVTNTTLTEEYNKSINVFTPAAWSAGGNLNNGRSHASGSGDKNSMVVAGGVGTTPDYSLTEEYNGSSWTTATSMPSGRYYVSGSGTQTAAIALGGRTPPNAVGNDTFEYNGTSWTSGGNYPTNIERSFGNGTQTASLASGGSTGPSVVSAANIYDGSSWTSTGSLTTPNMGSGSCGTTSASLNVGGFLGPAPTKTDRTEEFNGSTWATGTSFPSVIEGGGVAGIQTSAIIFGGKTPSLTTNSFTYDGTSYATNPSLGTARYAFALGTVGNTIGTAIGAGGYLSPGRAAQTEEFTGETTALNLKTLTTS
jgi:hypothetical protein